MPPRQTMAPANTTLNSAGLDNVCMTEPIHTVVEMLWEPDSPDAVLRSRFGFRDTDAAGRWAGGRLEEFWGVRVDACERIVMSAHNALAWLVTGAGPMVLKWSIAPQLFPRLAATAELTGWLADRGVPVSAPVPALDGRVQVETDGVSMGLQRMIRGQLLDVSDRTQVHSAGAALARLHAAMREYPDSGRLPDGHAPTTSLAQRVTGWVESAGGQVPVRARETLRRLIGAAPADPLPVQLIHGDYRAANIFCDGAEVAAIIDFEEASVDHPVVELAHSAVMLGTLFRDWAPVSESVRRQFLAGYESERRLSPVEARWWGPLVLWWSSMLIPAGDDPTGWRDAAMSQLD